MKPCRTLIVFKMIFFMLPFALMAQAGGAPLKIREPLKALVELENNDIVELKPFTISILVNHPNPGEVVIDPPPFNEEFFFERLSSSLHIVDVPRKRTRLSENSEEEDDDSHKWTELKITLVAAKEGQFTLGSWTITSPQYSINTLPLQLVVVKDKNSEVPPEFVWAGASSVRVNETGIAMLRVKETESGIKYPHELKIPVAAPRNAIVETLPISKQEELRGTVLRLGVLPISGNEVRLEARTVRYKDWHIVVPELKLSVAGAARKAGAQEETLDNKVFFEPLPESEAGEVVKTPEFPSQKSFGLPGFFDGAKCLALTERVRALWEIGNYALCLSVLRKAERDFIAGAAIAAFRRECEEALDLPALHNEVWLPPRLFAAFGILGLLIVVLCAANLIVRLILDKPLRFRKKRFILGAALCLFAAGGIIAGKLESGRRAVLDKTLIYDLPEQGAAGSSSFARGTPVLLRSASGNWLYVEAANGSSGWVPKSSASVY
jgi:hypothetical protein